MQHALMDDQEQAVAFQGAARRKGQAALLGAQAHEQTEALQALQLSPDRHSNADEQRHALLHAQQAHACAAVAGHWVPEPVLHALCSFATQWNPHVTWPSLRELLLVIHQVSMHGACMSCCMQGNLPSVAEKCWADKGGVDVHSRRM